MYAPSVLRIRNVFVVLPRRRDGEESDHKRAERENRMSWSQPQHILIEEEAQVHHVHLPAGSEG